MERVTNRDMFEKVASALDDQNLIDFINYQIELIDRRKLAPKAETALQIQNREMKNAICETLKFHNDGLTATEIANERKCSVQKITALLTQLVKEDRIFKVEAMGKAKARFFG